ncbi:hypothetical protein Fmac_005121 [Flemingia macrophylla]|uniref:Uncharacterized protein n=1 Tax=Flemingia macrophylla TaxID=520843 RepID=A0ABD1N6W6_9FABA
MAMAKQRAGERVIESRVFGRACLDSHVVNQGGKPPGVWKTLLRVIHSVDNGTGEVVKGSPLVKLADDLFLFNRPRLLPFLIHLVLFQNDFQLAFFSWSTFNSHKTLQNLSAGCFMDEMVVFPLVQLLYDLSTSVQWQQKYTNLESKVQTTLGALKANMIMKEGKIPDELVVFFDPQPQCGAAGMSDVRGDTNGIRAWFSHPVRCGSGTNQAEAGGHVTARTHRKRGIQLSKEEKVGQQWRRRKLVASARREAVEGKGSGVEMRVEGKERKGKGRNNEKEERLCRGRVYSVGIVKSKDF